MEFASSEAGAKLEGWEHTGKVTRTERSQSTVKWPARYLTIGGSERRALLACVTGQAPSTAHAHKMTMIRTVVIVRKVEIGIIYLKYNIQGWCVVAFLRGAGVIPHCKRAVPLAEHGNPPSPLRDAAANILLGFVAWPLLCHNTWWGENTNRRINCLPPPDLILLLSSAQ